MVVTGGPPDGGSVVSSGATVSLELLPPQPASAQLSVMARNERFGMLMDSDGADLFVATPTYSALSGDGFKNLATNFGRVEAEGTLDDGEHDLAKLYDSPGDDAFAATPTYGALSGDGFFNQVQGFDALMRPSAGQVCHSLIVVSYCTPGSAQDHED